MVSGTGAVDGPGTHTSRRHSGHLSESPACSSWTSNLLLQPQTTSIRSAPDLVGPRLPEPGHQTTAQRGREGEGGEVTYQWVQPDGTLAAPYAVSRSGRIAAVDTAHGWTTPNAYGSLASAATWPAFVMSCVRSGASA